ncbi:hypothetical protein Tsubulata_045608 [Turnera subulata]|uniref:FLZ-type domain-containing protein n=1 Tax=Turnera subulata TaxID=218843 RepID=A0A9Q0JDV2_9ROSI|nr:hypothetical protein Tsubulata_045608 [Turnera subulata]
MSFRKWSPVVRPSSRDFGVLINHALLRPFDHHRVTKGKKWPGTRKLLPEEDHRPCKIVEFTIGSPEREGDDCSSPEEEKGEEEYCSGKFLEACFLCKKKLKHDTDLFIYGYTSLVAFCSLGCREEWMDLDGFEEKISKESPQLITGAGKLIFTKDESKLGYQR